MGRLRDLLNGGATPAPAPAPAPVVEAEPEAAPAAEEETVADDVTEEQPTE